MVASQDRTRQSHEEEIVREIVRAIHSIKHGSLQLIIQDSKLIQIDKTEKVRFPREAGS